MGRKQQRVRYQLDTGNIEKLAPSEIKAILRAADELIASGGRNMLVKILKGSKDKRLLELRLDECPSYGFYHCLTQEQISHRIDWMIIQDYIRIEYYGRLPMLVFSDKGWAIERETYAEELYQLFLHGAQEGDFHILSEMRDVSRPVVLDLLEKVRASRNEIFLPILAEWKKAEVRKVRQRIGNVEDTIKSHETGPVIVCQKAQKHDAQRIADLIQTTVQEIYPNYYDQDVADFFCFLHSRERIKADIEEENVWMLLCDGKLAGTGSVDQNHITRVYVLPDMHRQGLGSRIMAELEGRIKHDYDTAQLDASIPAERLCEKRGYKTVQEKRLSLGTIKFDYKVMEKRLTESSQNIQ